LEKYKGKYRINSSRLTGWDYSQPGMYFITVCTDTHANFFGTITDGQMHLSPIGEIVSEVIHNTDQIRENIQFDEWVIMPNHLHLIIQIIDDGKIKDNLEQKNLSIGVVINQIKSKATKRIWANGNKDFRWQTRFYDHIVRNEASLNRIRQYIRENPLKWENDEYFAP
jgi:REP element-mobilizing transposase RayT